MKINEEVIEDRNWGKRKRGKKGIQITKEVGNEPEEGNKKKKEKCCGN